MINIIGFYRGLPVYSTDVTMEQRESLMRDCDFLVAHAIRGHEVWTNAGVLSTLDEEGNELPHYKPRERRERDG